MSVMLFMAVCNFLRDRH